MNSPSGSVPQDCFSHTLWHYFNFFCDCALRLWGGAYLSLYLFQVICLLPHSRDLKPN